ncbi:hypothetical protein FOA52_007231, partial [Chlamydomonas sp. UWO 241]
VLAQHARDAANASSASASGAGVVGNTYSPPDWGGPPDGVDYGVEVLRQGTVLGAKGVSEKGHYTFGRTPECDFVLEHPSASRLHAVLQFNGETKVASLYDCGSTHGTFLNKQRIKPNIFVPLPVGSTFKMGQSSRIYVFSGPSDLMPEEGLSRAQKKQLAQMEYSRKMAKKEQEVAKSQMAAVIAGEVTWGMGAEQDMASMNPEDLSSIDWRVYRGSNELSEKQQKLAERVRSREYKVANLRKEVERIQAKEKAGDGLTPGQSSTMVRNEEAVDKLMQEMEDLEEQLNESVRQALRDKIKAKEVAAGKEGGGGGAGGAAKRGRGRGLDEEDERYLEASDSEDEMYDRTRVASKAGSKKPRKGEMSSAPAVIESAQGLYGKKEVLDEVDALDAFMGDMKSKMEVDHLDALRKELADVEAQLARCVRLLKIADPDGWLQPGSKAAVAAKANALQALNDERQRRADAARARADAAAALAASTEFAEEFENEDDDAGAGAGGGDGGAAGGAAAGTSGDGGSDAASAAAAASAGGADGVAVGVGVAAPVTSVRPGGCLILKRPGGGSAGTTTTTSHKPRPSVPANADAAAAAVQLIAEFSASASAGRAGGHFAPGSGGGGVAADMALLAAAAEQRPVELDSAEWVPPTDQRGDGRTALNEKFGY